jgi:hypothetical protein
VIKVVVVALAAAISVLAQPSIFVQNAVFSGSGSFLIDNSTPSPVAPGSLISVPLLPFVNSCPAIQDPVTVSVTITQIGCGCAGLKAEILTVEDVQVIARVPVDFPISMAPPL